MLIEKAPDALPLEDAGGPVSRTMGPPGHLIESKPMLCGGAVYGDGELRHRTDLGGQLIRPKLRDRQGDGLIEGFGLDFNVMRDSIGVRE
jgi:hypothetical protein